MAVAVAVAVVVEEEEERVAALHGGRVLRPASEAGHNRDVGRGSQPGGGARLKLGRPQQGGEAEEAARELLSSTRGGG